MGAGRAARPARKCRNFLRAQRQLAAGKLAKSGQAAFRISLLRHQASTTLTHTETGLAQFLGGSGDGQRFGIATGG